MRRAAEITGLALLGAVGRVRRRAGHVVGPGSQPELRHPGAGPKPDGPPRRDRRRHSHADHGRRRPSRCSPRRRLRACAWSRAARWCARACGSCSGWSASWPRPPSRARCPPPAAGLCRRGLGGVLGDAVTRLRQALDRRRPDRLVVTLASCAASRSSAFRRPRASASRRPRTTRPKRATSRPRQARRPRGGRPQRRAGHRHRLGRRGHPRLAQHQGRARPQHCAPRRQAELRRPRSASTWRVAAEPDPLDGLRRKSLDRAEPAFSIPPERAPVPRGPMPPPHDEDRRGSAARIARGSRPTTMPASGVPLVIESTAEPRVAPARARSEARQAPRQRRSPRCWTGTTTSCRRWRCWPSRRSRRSPRPSPPTRWSRTPACWKACSRISASAARSSRSAPARSSRSTSSSPRRASSRRASSASPTTSPAR